MAARAQKRVQKSYTTAQRYSILEKFAHYKEQDKMTNVDAAGKVGVPFITLYSWIRNEMWKDNRHTTPPIRLQERTRKAKKARKERVLRPLSIHRKAKALPTVAAEPVEQPVQHPVQRPVLVEDKPIIVRLPNKVEIEFPDLEQARNFVRSLP